MPNHLRGEIIAKLNGKQYTLILTLGALAELESEYGGVNILHIIEQFEKKPPNATDMIRIIGAGLRGAGNQIKNQQIAHMTTEGGVNGYIDIVARLLNATFAHKNQNHEQNEKKNKSQKQPPT